MADYSSDSGYEMVLDNRRLIIAFAVLVLVCGCCFVVGFMEGKRQGYQAGAQTAAESMSKPVHEESLEPDSLTAAAEPGRTPAGTDAEEQRLNWYKNVAGQGEKPEIIRPSTPASAAPGPPVKKPAETAAVKAPATYSVQVGAFRQRDQADAKAQTLRARGFDCRIEPPRSAEDLYLLKIGRFKSRDDAIAMQLRLKQSGFSSFIKAN